MDNYTPPSLTTCELYKLTIRDQILYATPHSTTKPKLIEVLKGHFEIHDPFNINITKTLMNNYLEQHGGKIKLLYKYLNKLAIDTDKRQPWNPSPSIKTSQILDRYI